MSSSSYTIRAAVISELDAINRVIEIAIMKWQLPERVKRLSLPSYRYTVTDFEHFEIIIAQDEYKNITGIAAWEEADSKDTPLNKRGLLLHGLYVDPLHQHKGIGRQLFKSLEATAQTLHYDGLLVKAQEHAVGFFKAQSMEKCQIENPSRQYVNRFWKSLIIK